MSDDAKKSDGTINVHWTRETTIDKASINRFIDIVAIRLIYWGTMMMLCWAVTKAVVGLVL